MKTTAWLLAITLAATASVASAQRAADDQQVLRQRLEARYDVVPLTGGIGLRPRTRGGDVRLIEIADGTISLNGVAVTGRELRDRIGADADAILQVSYMSADDQRALFAAEQRPAAATEPPLERETGAGQRAAEPPPAERREPPAPSGPARARRASGDRVRIFGDVVVERDEEVTGQVVAVLGSVRVDGTVGDQVVAVLGSVELGPEAVVGGDIVSVGGRVRRAPSAQTRRGVTEISLADPEFRVHVAPWLGGWGPFPPFVSFGAVPRLIGTGFRLLLLMLLAGIVLVVGRRAVESAADRVTDSPLKTTVVGLVAEILIVPALVLTAVLMAVSIVGIPLLLLLPFVVLALIVMALVGFTGTAAAAGQWLQRRFSLGAAAPFVSVALGILAILSPLLVGRFLALAGWPVTPFAVLFVAAGFAVEMLAWASGFGAVLTNAFTRWQAGRVARTRVVAPPPPAVP
jgi:hypothetical protein